MISSSSWLQQSLGSSSGKVNATSVLLTEYGEIFLTGVCLIGGIFGCISGVDMSDESITVDCSPPVKFSSDLVCLNEHPTIFVCTGDV